MNPNDIIEKIKNKAAEFSKKHADLAKSFYVLGKKDAACTILKLVREEGVIALKDVAKEILKQDPDNLDAKWIIENECKLNNSILLGIDGTVSENETYGGT